LIDIYLCWIMSPSLARLLARGFVAAICSFAVANERRVGLLLLSLRCFPPSRRRRSVVVRFFFCLGAPQKNAGGEGDDEIGEWSKPHR
jgi:hypothetical protein